MAARCGDVHGPMASAGNVGLAAFLDALERAVMPRRRVMSAVRGADELLEFVVEAFVAKIPLLLRYPFLQPEMRLDLELGHGAAPWFCCARRATRVLTEPIARLTLLGRYGCGKGG